MESLIEATLVPGEEDVGVAAPLEVAMSYRAASAGLCCIVLLFVSLMVGFLVVRPEPEPYVMPTIAPSMAPSASPSFQPMPTLERIKERGRLRCGSAAISDFVIDAIYNDSFYGEITSPYFVTDKSSDVKTVSYIPVQ